MSKHLIGLILIDAPYSALNNAEKPKDRPNENIVIVKTLRKGRRGKIYPYVSGQAWRNWWRTTLQQEFKEWHSSPTKRETKIAFTAADPVNYDDDDVFGYMRAPKKTPDKQKEKDETLTRLSPLKCSPLISIAPQTPTNDWGVMARQEGDPVPYEHQFYACVLQGIFSLDLNAVGTFSDINRTGYQNIPENYIPIIQGAGGTQENENSPWILPKDIRTRRCQQTLQALPLLSGGAKLTSHLTDVTPKLIILSILDGGNHPFMNLIVEEDGTGKLSLPALRQVMEDYADRFLEPIYIGRRTGFMDNLDESLSQLKDDTTLPCEVVYDSPNRVIAQLAQKLEEHIGDTP